MIRILLVLLLALATDAHAQSGCTVLAENAEGRLRFCGNELLVESKVLDPSAIRLRAPSEQGGLGKISFDAGTKEMVLIIGAQSPGKGGELSLNFLKPGGSSTDADMLKVLSSSHEEGFGFRLPIFAPGSSGGPASDCLRTADGRWQLCQQGDGNAAQYQAVQTLWCPRWSTWTGLIPSSAWPTTGPTAVCRQ